MGRTNRCVSPSPLQDFIQHVPSLSFRQGLQQPEERAKHMLTGAGVFLLPNVPAAVTPISLWTVLGCLAQLPLAGFSVDAQAKPRRQRSGLQEQSAQLIPPELTLVTRVPGSYEDGCWYVVALEQGFGVMQVIRVTVVEGDDHCPRWNVSAPKRLVQLPESHQPTVLTQDLKMLEEVRWRNAEAMWVRR